MRKPLVILFVVVTSVLVLGWAYDTHRRTMDDARTANVDWGATKGQMIYRAFGIEITRVTVDGGRLYITTHDRSVSTSFVPDK